MLTELKLTRFQVIITILIYLLATCMQSFLISCSSDKEQTLISQDALKSKTKIDKFVRLDTLLNRFNGYVCILYPYQDAIFEETPHRVLINSHLKSSKYIANESSWSLVYVSNNSVTVSQYQRSAELDILAPHELAQHKFEAKYWLKIGFKPSTCSPIAQAEFLKIESQNRKYLIMGSTK